MNTQETKYTPDQIDQYLRGRLSEDERDAFEVALIESPVLQREVQLQDDLMRGMKASSAELLAVEKPGLIAQLIEMVGSPAWAYAATAMLVITTGLLLVGGEEPGLVIDQVVYVEQMRSGEPAPISVRSGQRVMLSIDAARFEQQRVQFELTGARGVVLALTDLSPNEEYMLHISLPALADGDYTARLYNDNDVYAFALQVAN